MHVRGRTPVSVCNIGGRITIAHQLHETQAPLRTGWKHCLNRRFVECILLHAPRTVVPLKYFG